MAEDPTGRAVRNLLTIQRVGNTLTKQARDELRALFDDIVAEIARYDPTAVGADRWRRARTQKLLDAVRLRNSEAFGALHKSLRGSLGEAGAAQAAWASHTLLATIGVAGNEIRVSLDGLTPAYFRKILDTDPFQGETLREWLGGLERATTRRVRQQVQIGMVNNESIDDIVRRVRGRSVGRGVYAGGVWDTTTRDAETVVRTAVNEISNRAHMDVYQQNKDITTGYQYVATLDARTSDICMSLDGQAWAWDDPGAKRPPQHPRCRSTIVSVINWDGLGIEPPDDGTRAARRYTMEDGKLKPLPGQQVPASTDYERWLRSQPKGVVAEILGPGRAKLFNEGKISLRDLVRKDGTTVPLSQLRDA